MKEYLEHLPIFFLVVLLGIISNLLIKYRKDKKSINIGRILEETFSGLWISIVVAGGLDFYTNWSVLLISGLSSMAGFFHSKIIDIFGNDILVLLSKYLKEWINKKLKNDKYISEE